ncbi:PIG-L family deacetylase [Endozoicomonas sp.]|nr:PIG-L family deacetylase [Endozoicomonas sp.]
MTPLKRLKYITLVALVAILMTTIASGLYVTSTVLFICAYVIYELIGTDHIHYNVQQDYDYQCLNSHASPLTIEQNILCIPENHRETHLTNLLEVTCKASISGHLFDPFIDIQCGQQSVRQYFERGFQGKRYLNISHLPLNASETLRFQTKHCCFTSNSCHVISLKNPDINGKKILVIAPHADDAEIAAFGLYSRHNSMVVTITAGESEPDQCHRAMTKNTEAASLLKGQLRAWDSVAVPLWAGLKSDKVINLGYPDNSLENLHANPATCFPSESKALFRAFNSINLPTDNQPSISWQSLTHDLTDILNHFQPDIIVTPHPEMDAHKDHQLSTKAIQQASTARQGEKSVYLYYINHLPFTDRWPFGPHGTMVAPAPGKAKIEGFYSHPVESAIQTQKAYGLDMMHDLRKPMKIKHQLRYWLQQKLLGRAFHPLSKDPYFRKSVRSNELFIVEINVSNK